MDETDSRLIAAEKHDEGEVHFCQIVAHQREESK